jgi:molybdopterin-guanine dinucleotide biosynthesis protein A
MPIRTIETVVAIDDDRRLIVQLPADVLVGLHRVALVLDEVVEHAEPADAVAAGLWRFPVVECAQWPADMPLTREELYDDHGR